MGKIIFLIINAALTAVSPAIRALLTRFYNDLKAEALKSDNKWDDLLMMVVGVLFHFEDE